MNREEFIVSAAIILLLAFLLGWLSRWLLQRLNMVSEKDLNQFNKISAALHEAEENNEKARVRELELNKKVSQLEGSKIFTKKICEKYRIPTAQFGVFKNDTEAYKYLENANMPIVVKADGLAAGKGVTICKTKKQVLNVSQEIFKGKFKSSNKSRKKIRCKFN